MNNYRFLHIIMTGSHTAQQSLPVNDSVNQQINFKYTGRGGGGGQGVWGGTYSILLGKVVGALTRAGALIGANMVLSFKTEVWNILIVATPKFCILFI